MRTEGLILEMFENNRANGPGQRDRRPGKVRNVDSDIVVDRLCTTIHQHNPSIRKS